MRVDTQLNMALALMNSGTDLNLTPEQAQALISGMRDYFNQILARFPVVADDPNMQAIQSLLDNPLGLLTRQDELAAAIGGLAQRFGPNAADPIAEPYLMPTALGSLLTALPNAGASGNIMAQLTPSYLNEDGTAFKIDVIFAGSPSSYEAMDTMHQIRQIIKPYDGRNGDAVASGGTAIVTDIRETIDRDLLRAIGFVLLGIFFVLLGMLRSIVAPIYLICTVLLSFTCTLGITNAVFRHFWGVEGLTWYVPFFMFVFLVALGMDYSIFLFGRIKEEVAYHGLREGVHIAVARTGAIITSAGAILSGTFAAMATGEIKGLAEVGFAVAVGVLIDTFVVRTMLDPALATLFGRWTWWPGGVPQPKDERRVEGVSSVPEAGD